MLLLFSAGPCCCCPEPAFHQQDEGHGDEVHQQEQVGYWVHCTINSYNSVAQGHFDHAWVVLGNAVAHDLWQVAQGACHDGEQLSQLSPNAVLPPGTPRSGRV